MGMMDKEVTITGRRSKPVWKHNPISGHSWTESRDIQGFEVHGGYFLSTTHKTLSAAETEKALREELVEEFPDPAWAAPIKVKKLVCS